MANNTIKADKLTAAVEKILKEYGDSVSENVEDVTKQVSQKAAQQIRASARTSFGGSGKYAKGWGVTMEKTRLETTAVIHNKSLPGLPHLLEHGHISIRNGRRIGYVKGREHIAPVEQQVVELYEKEIKAKL